LAAVAHSKILLVPAVSLLILAVANCLSAPHFVVHIEHINATFNKKCDKKCEKNYYVPYVQTTRSPAVARIVARNNCQ